MALSLSLALSSGGGASAFDIFAVSDAHWDPELHITYSGSTPATLNDQTGNGHTMLYRGWAAGASATTMNGLAAVNFFGPSKKASLYNDSVAALITGGVSVPWVAYGTFKLANLSASHVAVSLDDDSVYRNNSQLGIDTAGALTLRLNENSTNYATATFSETMVAGTIYTYVVVMNSDQTCDMWLNGVKIDEALAFGVSGTFPNLPAMDRLSFGAFDPTSSDPATMMAGDLAACGFIAGTTSDANCAGISSYLFDRYGI